MYVQHSHASAPKCMHTHCTHELKSTDLLKGGEKRTTGHQETEGRTDTTKWESTTTQSRANNLRITTSIAKSNRFLGGH